MKNNRPSLRILMLAPEPFFQPRGTPISIYFRLKALSALGHKVDLATYHIGENKEFPFLRIERIPNIFGIKKIKIGPSFAKLPLDLLLCFKALWLIMTRKYDLVFSHEEGGWIGSILSRIWGIPHVYDMHSSLPQQLKNYEFTRSKFISGIFNLLERMVFKFSEAIIVICPDLKRIVEAEGFGKKTILLENILDFDSQKYSHKEIQKKREAIAPGKEKILLYAGNFQPYQGITLLLQSLKEIKEKPVKLLLVGGKGLELENTKSQVKEMGLLDKVYFIGQVPPSKVSFYIEIADALVSPRVSGTNTPLKIYSFLKSGKPLVATKLWTHTQVLDEKIAILSDANPISMAAGISLALFDPEGQKRARSAKIMTDKNYTQSNYHKIITDVLNKALKNIKE